MSRLPTPHSPFTACLIVLLVGSLTAPAAAARSHSSADEARSSYRIKPGDTLSGLAMRLGTSVETLSSLNGLRNPDHIVAGRTLRTPASGSNDVDADSARSSSNGASDRGRSGSRHLVVPGDTLSGIAARYGISQADLARWNGITGETVYATTRLALYNPGPPPATPFVCPVPPAKFSNDWAFPRSGGRVHVGTDLFAPTDTPVRAPVSGTVTTGQGSVGGRQFWLTDVGGNRWMGSHLDAFGDTGSVRAGDVIGYVGDTGNARGRPQLHLEYHPAKREPVNLYASLQASC